MSAESSTAADFIPLTNDGGLFKKIIREGTVVEGEEAHPPKGCQVTVHYVGTLENGTKFDASRDRDEPFKFKLGKGEVIKGWDVGVASMKKGELAILKIREDYGYGKVGSPPTIPGGATLIFEVELLSWNSWDDVNDGKIFKKVVTEAAEDEWKTPDEGARCVVNYTCKLQSGEVVEEKKGFQFIFGEEQVTPVGLEKACESMKIGEKSMFKVLPEFGYGAAGNAEKKIPANATLLYDIEMVDLERELTRWDVEGKEKLEFATKKKDSGNAFFKQGNNKIAKKKYNKALEYVVDEDFKEEDDRKKAKDLRIQLNSNVSLILLKENKFREVITTCNKILEEDATNIKALFRRAQAYSSSAEYEPAVKDLKTALQQDPSNTAVKNELVKVEALYKKEKQADKKMYSKMFSALGDQ